MKRLLFIAAAVLFAVGGLSAQGWGRAGPGGGPGCWGPNRGPDQGFSPPAAAETARVNGNLSLIRGRIALQADGKTYYILGLQRLIGFIDGLKEGASVTLEGFVVTPPRAQNRQTGPAADDTEARFLLAQKLIINGREYDELSPAFPDREPGENRRHFQPKGERHRQRRY
jgi:hypothetical protein